MTERNAAGGNRTLQLRRLLMRTFKRKNESQGDTHEDFSHGVDARRRKLLHGWGVPRDAGSGASPSAGVRANSAHATDLINHLCATAASLSDPDA